MFRYLNPGGHNWGAENLDGYGISLIGFIVTYTICFYTACAYLWFRRHHPVIKMRKIGLAILSILILHVYMFMVFIVYPLNGAFPCSVEFWIMSMYLPLGIGLFQAQNQQLLIVSREQDQLLRNEQLYKPLYPRAGFKLCGPKYWLWRFKLWWQGVATQSKYEGFVAVGMIAEFFVSLVIYCISRKFNHYGIVSHATTPGLCRRGFEWAPSIAWQALWNYTFGPYLLWKIRMIHDIYHWRLQTILAIIAGLPGTPLWLIAVYTNSFASVNKWWVPPMWLVPGLITMELVTLIFPIVAIIKHDRTARQTKKALDAFDFKQAETGSKSLLTRSTISKRSGQMFSSESLDECLNGTYNGLQIYASCEEFNGENIMFLVRVLAFKNSFSTATANPTTDPSRTRTSLFRTALSIFISLVHTETAAYPINIESPIYAKLDAIFGAATTLVASTNRTSRRSNSTTSTTPGSKSAVAPWEEPITAPISPTTMNEHDQDLIPDDDGDDGFQLHAMMPTTRPSSSHHSSEHIIPVVSASSSAGKAHDPHDPLADFSVPAGFNECVFDDAYKSIRHMVWTETWQRFMQWKRSSGSSV